MDKKEIIAWLKESKHRKIKVAVTDMDGVLRGKFMHVEKLISALESGFGFCSVVFGWDMCDLAYDNTKMVGWHMGYGDFDAQLDLSSFRTIPWEEGTPFLLADFSSEKVENLPICPRSLLKNSIAKAENMGYSPMFSQEFEWFNFKETSSSLEGKNYQAPLALTPGMFGYSVLRMSENKDFFHALFDQLEGFGVPLEGLHTETGPGVTEAAIQYSDILEAADRAVLFKTGVQEIAKKHNIVASFMAKQTNKLPGNGGHIHQSLWDLKKTKNLFYDGTSKDRMSGVMKSFLAGQLHCLPEILPMFAPTINSYKRLVEGAWAPTTLTWGFDNRTCALRVLTPGQKSTRIEHRVVGSDVNPYLAMAACLASGLYGIEHNLKLDVPATTGNGYRNMTNGVLPSNLLDASNKMKASHIAYELFGEAFVDHFTCTREWEWKQFSAAVTDWEIKRYFEII